MSFLPPASQELHTGGVLVLVGWQRAAAGQRQGVKTVWAWTLGGQGALSEALLAERRYSGRRLAGRGEAADGTGTLTSLESPCEIN